MEIRARLDYVKKALKLYQAVLAFVYDSRRDPVDYIERLMWSVAPAFEPLAGIIGVDASAYNVEEVRKAFDVDHLVVPAVMFFLHGRRVWQQQGLFYNIEYDKLAIRVGIRKALEAWGIKPAQLGLKLHLL